MHHSVSEFDLECQSKVSELPEKVLSSLQFYVSSIQCYKVKALQYYRAAMSCNIREPCYRAMVLSAWQSYCLPQALAH